MLEAAGSEEWARVFSKNTKTGKSKSETCTPLFDIPDMTALCEASVFQPLPDMQASVYLENPLSPALRFCGPLHAQTSQQ